MTETDVMPHRPLQTVIDQLRRTVARDESGDVTDAELLDAFVRRREEAAFELLVWRHAALVLGVCQRVLRDRHEAEDAFQATFLVFVRKARAIRKHASVASWLHRVAFRVALRARSRAAKRAHDALPGDEVPARESPDDLLWRDLRPVLEEEVNRLPEKYRRPFVLCYLEGYTNEQAARHLGCPKGTVLSWLLRGRERLRTRLARRGIALSGSLLATLFASRASEAAVPAVLVHATVKAAIRFAAGHAATGLVSARTAAWTEGVLKAMFFTKLRVAAVLVLAFALVTTGAGLLSQRLLAEPRPGPQERGKLQPEPGRGVRDPRGGVPRSDVRGVLKAVDAAKGTITVAVGDGRQDPVDQTFALAKTTEVGINVGLSRRGSFREGKLADLAPGAIIVLHLAEDQKTVDFLAAEGPMARGIIKSVDAGKNTITLTLPVRPAGRGERGEATEEEKTYAIAQNAEIGVDDGRGKTFSLKEARLPDLPAGAVATLKLSPDLKQVQIVRAEGPVVRGLVKSVNAGKKQIQLTLRMPRGDDVGEEKSFDVAADADVLLDDGKGRRFSLKEGHLTDVPAGATAMLKLAVDQQTVTSIQAEGPGVGGLLKVVDPAKGTLTLVLRAGRGDNPGEEKTYAVARDARIQMDGKEAKLADLKAGEEGPRVYLRLSLDQQAVNSITVGGGRR